MKKTVIIYDFDGVIVDSQEAIAWYYGVVFEHFGLPQINWDNPAERAQVFSMTYRQLMSQYATGERLEEMLKYVPPYEKQQMLDAHPLEAGVMETIPLLSKDYRLAICTNRGESVDAYLEYYNLDTHFSYVVNSTDVKNPKPDPEGVLKILEYFGITPQEALYIGDSGADYYAAKSAGVRFIAYTNELFEAPVITNHKEIFEHL